MVGAAEHGHFKTGKDDQLLMFSAEGPWNDQTFSRGIRELGSLIKQADIHRPWAQLSCLYGESLMPPSVFKGFTKHTAIRKKSGLCFLAVVIKDSDIEFTIRSQLSAGYEETGIDYGFFDSIEEALEHISSINIDFDKQAALSFFGRKSFSLSA